MVKMAFDLTPRGSLVSTQLNEAPVRDPLQPPPASFKPHHCLQKAGIRFPALLFALMDSVEGLASMERSISLEGAQGFKAHTRAQRLDATWFRYHTFTITSSVFKKVANAKKWSDALLKDIFNHTDLSRVAAIRHGIDHEEDARKVYCEKMKLGQPVEVESAGLVLHTKYSYLGASPDGVVFDASAHPRFGLLEIKCPYRAFSLGLTVREACRSLPSFCCELVDENVQLKRTHE